LDIEDAEVELEVVEVAIELILVGKVSVLLRVGEGSKAKDF
jgi:hypothetical protein